MLIILIKRSPGVWRDTHLKTAESGIDFISSETTLVSRRNMHRRYSSYCFPSFSHSESRMNSRVRGSSSTPPSRAKRR